MAMMRRKHALTALLVLLVSGGAFVGVGSIRTPTGVESGSAFHGVPAKVAASRPASLRVATFNIHSGQPESGGENLELTAKTLAGFDFAGLNEVRGALLPSSPDQAQRLGEILGVNWLFLPTERRYWHEAFGNAALSRLPVHSWERRPLASPTHGSRRNVTIVKLEQPKVTLLLTHIARNADQETQLKALAKLFLEEPEPVVLMGDLNVTSENAVIAELLKTPGVRDPLDEKQPEGTGKHIDWILVRGMDVLDAGQRELGASDHPLVWAELK